MSKSYASAPFMAKLAAPAEYERKVLREQSAAVKDEDKRKIAVSIGDVTVSEGLSKEVVLKIAQNSLHEVEKCYAGGGLRGKFVVRLTISAGGKVRDIKVVSNALNNRNTGQCIVEQLKKWQFPAVPDGSEVKATISLVFGS
jgi:hypothetical protein